MRCEKRIAKGEWNDAVAILGELLADESFQDYLIPYNSRRFGSLRSRTESILGAIDSKHLESYRLKYGIRARKMLDKGIETDDLTLLKKTSARFFFTDAGAEATMLLGHLELSNGQPSAAQSHFAKLLRFPDVAQKFEPEVSILAATCQLLGGNEENAKKTLVALKRKSPNATVTLMDQSYPIFNEDDQAVTWLTSIIGDSPLSQTAAISQWLMFRGNPARTGRTGTGFPLLVPRWEQRLVGSIAEQELIQSYVRELIEESRAPTPAPQPLVVGSTIVLRNSKQMYGVDFETGIRKWTYPPPLAWNRDLDDEKITVAESQKIKQRAIQDSLFGQSSSDGRYVFTIPFPGATSNDYLSSFENAATSDPLDERRFNELVAIDAENSGALKWRVGGSTGLDEPKLAEAYFLGESLPFEGTLYCACLQNEIVKLVALDTKTGKLKWSQQLAATTAASFTSDHLRRLAGVSPSCADGTIICLTGTGAVVAVDIATRSLMWGFEFRKPDRKTEAIGDDEVYSESLSNVWRDSQVTISNGLVLITPVSSRELLCLDANEGTRVWFEDDGFIPRKVSRETALYLAGIEKSKAILVGQKNIRAIELFTGKTAWETATIAHGMPSGRGYIGDGCLYLPTTNKRVIRVDLATGKILDAIVTGRILGNLIRFQGDVISQSADRACSWPELKFSEQQFSGVDNETLDAADQFTKSQVLIQTGAALEGLSLLNELVNDSPLPKHASLLAICFEELKESNPAEAIKVLDLLKSKFPNYDATELERQRTIANIRNGDNLKALNLTLEQITKNWNPKSTVLENTDQSRQKNGLSIPCDTIDRLPKITIQPSAGPTITEPNANQEGRRWIQYTASSWRRTQLVMAYRNLAKEDPTSAIRFSEELGDLLTGSIAESSAKTDYLLQNVPLQLLNAATLNRLGKWKLNSNQFAAALAFANQSIDLETSVDGLLLKSEICLRGNDPELANSTLAAINRDDLNKDQRQLFDALSQKQKQFADGIELASTVSKKPLYRSKKPFDESLIRDQTPKVVESVINTFPENFYRVPMVFVESDRSDVRQLALFMRPFADDGVFFEVRNPSGEVVRNISFEMPEQTGYDLTPYLKLAMRDNLAELYLANVAVMLDWFKVLAGEDAVQWKLPGSPTSEQYTVRGPGNTIVVAAGDELHCLDATTGNRIWKRATRHRNSQLAIEGDVVASWHQHARKLHSYDVQTGQLLQSVTLRRYEMLKRKGAFWMAWHPLRKSETSVVADEIVTSEVTQTDTGTNAVSSTAAQQRSPYTAFRLTVFHAHSGQIVWSVDLPNQTKRCFFEDDLCLARPDGSLQFLNFETGKPTRQLKIEVPSDQLQDLESVRVFRHRDGIVAQLTSKSNDGDFTRGQSRYTTRSMNHDLAFGPVMLFDDETGQPKWPRPATIEQMEYLVSQPYDSPCLFFGRLLFRQAVDGNRAYHFQFAMIDSGTGKLWGLLTVPEGSDSYLSHVIEWLPSSSKTGFVKLGVKTKMHRKDFEFSLDPNGPPSPIAHLPYNSVGTFDDRVFTNTVSQLTDTISDQLRQKAIEANRLAKEKAEQERARLQKEMGIGEG